MKNKKNKEYYYLVSFSSMREGDLTPGFGHLKLTLDYEIESFTDIDNIAKSLKDNSGLNNVVIINVMRMKKGYV